MTTDDVKQMFLGIRESLEQKLYNKCRAVYNQRLTELDKTLDSVSDELEHRLWFHMMDEINP